MSGMPDMTLTPLAEAVAPRTSKIINIAFVFLKEEKICYKMIYCIQNGIGSVNRQKLRWKVRI